MVDYLKQLTQNIITDEEPSIDEETLNKYIEASKALNPLGNVISAEKSYANMSIYNWREEYIRKFTMTALIGYIYRLAEEFDPTDEIDAMKVRFKGRESEIPDEEKRIRDTYRRMIKRFLDRNFEFNPDAHLRAAHTDNDKDPERKPKTDLIRQRIETRPVVDKIQGKIAQSPDATYSYIRESILQASQLINSAYNNTLNTVKVLSDDGTDLEDKLVSLTKNHIELKRHREEINKVAAPLALADTLQAVVVNPPVNVFHHFKRYSDNHFEQLRDIVQALYNEKPDIEFSVHYYDTFKTEEDAKRHKVQHESEFQCGVLTIENSGVTLLGSFKQNRERVDFYNKNTEPIKRMAEQQEQDHKLGKDLMEKKIKDEKRKNVLKDGPDAPGLANYAKAIGVVKDLGSRKGLTTEEQDQLVKAQREKEAIETPDDSIQVDVFYPEMDAEGNTKLSKSKFYTQAEAPLHMQKDSEYSEKYQPKRPDGVKLEDTLSKKMITSKDGKKIEITSLKAKLNKLKDKQ